MSHLQMDNIDGPFKPNPKSLDGVPDLCMLTYLGELNVLHNLDCRYKKGDVYTSTTAKVLVAMNPYEPQPHNYTEEKMKQYQDQKANLEGLADKNSLPPHLFWVANSAYNNLLGTSKNQSIIVCGESGSGKTESAKYMMRFLAFTTTSSSTDPTEFAEAEAIGQQVLDANPILESYGNAKTLINNNSSRFGKFTKMLFKDAKTKGAKKLVGAAIDVYLLEKSRVVFADEGERNYHIFYQLTHCRSQHPELGLTDPMKMRYTGQSNCVELVDQRYPGAEADVRWHKELEEAWKTLKIPDEEKNATYAVVAAILHLGDLKFEDRKAEGSDIGNPENIKKAAELLGVDEAKLRHRMEIRVLALPGGKLLEKPLNPDDADFNRDSFNRNLYNGLFRWVVHRINMVSRPADADAIPTYIGILDVFGFEIFANNSFEQFCINFCNERLQQYFNEHVLMAEQLLYQREALLWNPIDLPDNQDTIDLVTRKPYGIYAILDSTCIQPKGDDVAFTSNLFKQFKYHPKLRKVERREARGSKQQEAVNGFTIKHYAGTVLYNAKEFLIKNSDSSEFESLTLMFASKNKVAKEALFIGSDGVLDTAEPVRSHKRSFLSVGSVFSDQLVALMTTLKKTAPYFVRCVKPNGEKKPKHFVGDFVRPQLRCGGLIEALRIIKLGFPTRCKYERVHELFAPILKKKPVKNLNLRDFTEAICAVLGNPALKPNRDEFQMGLSMIFFRPGKQEFLTDILDKDPSTVSDAQIEQIREYLTRKRWVRAAGLTKGWLRTNSFLHATRFTKAAVAMTIYYRVFGRALAQARRTLHGKSEEEEARKRQQEAEFQAALRAKQQLEDLKKREAEQQAALEAEKARVAGELTTMEGQLAAEKAKTKEQTQKYMDMKKEKAESVTKYLELLKRTNEERDKLNADIKTEKDNVRSAQAEADSAKSKAIGLEADLQKSQRELDEVRASLGAGKEAYEKQISDLQGELDQVKASLGAGKEAYEKKISDLEASQRAKDDELEELRRKLRLSEEGRESDKKEFERRLGDKDKTISDLEGRLRDAEAAADKARAASDAEANKLRDEADGLRKQLREEESKNSTKISVLEKEMESKKAELEKLKEEVIKQKDAELDQMREEVKRQSAAAAKAKADAAKEISDAREKNKKGNEKLEDDLMAKTEALALARADLRECERERDLLKEKLERETDLVKKEVAAEHKRQHQAEMNELQEKLDRQIRDLKDEVRSLEQQLDVARKWRTNAGRR